MKQNAIMNNNNFSKTIFFSYLRFKLFVMLCWQLLSSFCGVAACIFLLGDLLLLGCAGAVEGIHSLGDTDRNFNIFNSVIRLFRIQYIV